MGKRITKRLIGELPETAGMLPMCAVEFDTPDDVEEHLLARDRTIDESRRPVVVVGAGSTACLGTAVGIRELFKRNPGISVAFRFAVNTVDGSLLEVPEIIQRGDTD